MSPNNKLLIVEDDMKLADLISSFLTRSGFEVSSVEKGVAAIEQCKQNSPDLVILDLMLPDLDGFTVCQKLRSFYKGRILMLTASGSDLDQVLGFECGIDDYVIKPVEPRVLLARVKSLLKRDRSEGNTTDGFFTFGNLTIDNNSKSATIGGGLIDLTSHEFELLYLLASHSGDVLSRDKIYTCLRGFGYDGTNRSVDLKISKIRRKLGDDANNPQKIKTVWGKGYLFVSFAWE